MVLFSLQKNAQTVTKLVFFTSILVLSYFFIQHIYENVQPDIKDHIDFISAMAKGTLIIPHFLWHALVYCLHKVTGISLVHAALIFTALCITLLASIKYSYFAYFLKKENKSTLQLCLLCILSMIAMPIYIPWFNQSLYLGQGGSGIWHSPTLLLLKPLAFLSIFFSMQWLHQKSTQAMVLALCFTLLSIVAKPNFVLIFLPAFLCFLVFQRKDFPLDKRSVTWVASLVIGSVLVLALQYYLVYIDYSLAQKRFIVLRLGAVWRHYTPSIVLSILITLPLPLFVIALNKRKAPLLVFAWLLVFFGIALSYLFAETNARHDILLDANFFWGYFCAIDVVFTFSLLHYIKYYQDYKRYALWGNALIFLQAASGVIYIKHIIINNNYF